MFDPKYVSWYTNALVVWTGGGNDIVSAVPVAAKLQEYGIQTDIAGVLSWAAFHTYNWSPEKEINKLTTDTKRYISHINTPSVTFVDPYLEDVVRWEWLTVNNFYNFSTRFGTKNLTYELQKLIKEKQYDLLVAVDVGWDILARWSQDSHILSPMMDWTMLRVLSDLDIDSILLEFGLGTDGELRPSSIDDIIDELRQSDVILDTNIIDKTSPNMVLFKNVFDKISSVRKWNTNVQTLKTLEYAWTDKNLMIPYRFRTQLWSKKRFTWFDVELLYTYFWKTFTMDLQSLTDRRKLTAISYENILEQYVKLKSIQPQWKTECDLFCVWSADNFTTAIPSGYCLQFTCPSFMIDSCDRSQILSASFDLLLHDSVDVLLMFADDISDKVLPKWCTVMYVDELYALIYTDLNPNTINELKEKILLYRN